MKTYIDGHLCMKLFRRKLMVLTLAAAACCSGRPATEQKPLADEDGYKLWLRYANPGEAASSYRKQVKQLHIEGNSATSKIIQKELKAAIKCMLGHDVKLSGDSLLSGSVLIGTPQNSSVIRNLKLTKELEQLGGEGFIIRSTSINEKRVIIIAANTDIGTLYGGYHFLRLMQTGKPIDSLDIAEAPALQLRMMNHWDRLDGRIERGYAGRSLWQWDELPDTLSPRYSDYARACASIGINAAAVNNVNADPLILSEEYLEKVAALADLWRPYGVRMYLSVNFASPLALDGLKTADPLDKNVIAWWKSKADEIYKRIPDFGGFVVKADSEGQPGPKTYGRSHAEGANMLADALAPHNGIVLWRAFIYDTEVDPDRTKRAYLEFTRLDGRFRPNVSVQVKNGTLDFQPREPFHPLFGGLKKTSVIAEIQASQEYLGQAKHLVYHGPIWKEFLDSDTYAKGKGSTVSKVLAGEVYPNRITGLVSVTNPGLDPNWCGHHFSQANWFAFGRLAWNPDLTAEAIADEWIRMTFTNDDNAVSAIRDMMMGSYETFVRYSMPLGLNGLIGGDHYAPEPWHKQGGMPAWSADYYHNASTAGIGYDRTRRGNHAVDQYHRPVSDLFNDPETCPEKFLLWFHYLPWDYTMKSGRTLWEELQSTYQQGAAEAAEMQKVWQSLKGKIDARRHKEVADRLAVQVADSAKWRDKVLAYFGRFAEQDK
ncbi:alpha-glucuronidase [Verrucomicrobia bacterium S94]|nr:alpha-glucuronidase [Verrucomicrobia bacterium S94]